MRNKIFAELVKRFPGLDKKFLGRLADKLAKKVTEESGIDQAITDFDNAASIQDLATEFQQEGDRRVNDAKKEWEKNNPKAGAGKTEDDDEDEEDDDEDEDPKPEKGKDKSKGKSSNRTPKYIRELSEGFKALSQTVQQLVSEKNTVSIQDTIKRNEKMKGIPEVFWSKRKQPEKLEDVDAFVDEAVLDWEQIHPTEEGARKPALGGSGGGTGKDDTGGKKASKEELDAVMNNIM